VVNRLAMFAIAPSLGGLESIVTQPVTTTHHGLDPDERAARGITDNMIRLSVGLEDPGDLIRTWTRAPERPCSEHPGRSRHPGRRRLRAAARSPGPAVHTDRADAAGLGGPLDRSCRQADGARPAAPPRPRSRRDHWAPGPAHRPSHRRIWHGSRPARV
jgi:cystathionine gamma-synthase/methionine-gamma-lyase